MTDFTDTKPLGLYEAAIGEKNQDYYVAKFEDFDKQGPGLHASWNWAAFFFTGFWALYRKMYGWFVIWVCLLSFFGLAGKAALNSQAGSFWVLVANFTAVISFAALANSLYHSNVKSRINSAQMRRTDAARVTRKLLAGGSVHKWVPIVGVGIFAIGVVVAVVLPAFQGDAKRHAPFATASPKVFSHEEAVGIPAEKESATQQNLSELAAENQQLLEDKKILRSQGVGGNQSLTDVLAWGNSQLSARLFVESDVDKANDFVLMWQRQIINKTRLSPERSLFLGYSIVLMNYDSEKALCRPDMSRNGGVENVSGDNVNIYPQCFSKN